MIEINLTFTGTGGHFSDRLVYSMEIILGSASATDEVKTRESEMTCRMPSRPGRLQPDWKVTTDSAFLRLNSKSRN